jgi:hypothetical protein
MSAFCRFQGALRLNLRIHGRSRHLSALKQMDSLWLSRKKFSRCALAIFVQVAVFAVVGVFRLPGSGRDEITPLFRDFANVYLDFAVRNKKQGHTDASLAKIDKDWDKVVKQMKKVLPAPYQPSGWGTSKVHTNAHSTETVKDRGTHDEYSADMFERSHKSTAKTPFRASNKNDIQLQMVKHVQDRLALRSAGEDFFKSTPNERAVRQRVSCRLETELLGSEQCESRFRSVENPSFGSGFVDSYDVHLLQSLKELWQRRSPRVLRNIRWLERSHAFFLSAVLTDLNLSFHV